MAGFFGLFNYDKVGPGIRKDAPQKRIPFVFIETFFRNFWKFITVNLVYFIISIPMITNGLAMVGITHVVRNTARDKHSFGLSDFFETIKKNWKQALIVGIINTVATIAIIFDLTFFFSSEGTFGTIGLGISMFVTLVFIIMNFYIWTMMITFSFNIKQLYKNSFKFVFINFWKNLLCLILVVFSLIFYILIFYVVSLLSATIIPIAMTLEIIIFLCTYPCFINLMIQYFVFPQLKKYIIDPYYKENPYADIEKRRDLGLEVEEPKRYDENGEEIIEEEDIVFED